jgi:hypothetical protein
VGRRAGQRGSASTTASLGGISRKAATENRLAAQLPKHDLSLLPYPLLLPQPVDFSKLLLVHNEKQSTQVSPTPLAATCETQYRPETSMTVSVSGNRENSFCFYFRVSLFIFGA